MMSQKICRQHFFYLTLISYTKSITIYNNSATFKYSGNCARTWNLSMERSLCIQIAARAYNTLAILKRSGHIYLFSFTEDN